MQPDLSSKKSRQKKDHKENIHNVFSPEENEIINALNKYERIESKNVIAYPTSRADAPIRLVDKAQEIENATQSIQNGVHQKLDIILNEIRHLQKMAKDIIEKAENDIALHQIPCNFEKKTGDVIYLYLKNSKNKKEHYFSRLSPKDWNFQPLDEYKGAYEIQFDMSYKKLDEN